MIRTETAEIVQIFKDRGFKATPQRIAVYKYLCEHRTHPDVESVYRAVLEDNPAFSKTTVYNALQALDACGLIIPVTIDSGRIHYDADTRFHGHFRCEKCGRIYDWTALPSTTKMCTSAAFAAVVNKCVIQII